MMLMHREIVFYLESSIASIVFPELTFTELTTSQCYRVVHYAKKTASQLVHAVHATWGW
jgi:hypothetical protein